MIRDDSSHADEKKMLKEGEAKRRGEWAMGVY
jgi:hypothetical protein